MRHAETGLNCPKKMQSDLNALMPSPRHPRGVRQAKRGWTWAGPSHGTILRYRTRSRTRSGKAPARARDRLRHWSTLRHIAISQDNSQGFQIDNPQAATSGTGATGEKAGATRAATPPGATSHEQLSSGVIPESGHRSVQLVCLKGANCGSGGLHSMTSSARASKLGGTMRPSAFAVLRLITS